MRDKIEIFGRTIHLPRSRTLRIAIGFILIACGLVGFLPVLGYWMIPLGILVLSREFHWARRLRRRWVVWRGNGRKKTAETSASAD
jgi:purine-cytosine permease-like protein